MRIKLTDIGRQYGFNPDRLFVFAKERDKYALSGKSVDDASVPVVMMRHLAWDFKHANKGDWRLVEETLFEFLKIQEDNEL